MQDWICELKAGQRILDLCSGTGSFSTHGLAASVVALDEDPEAFQNAAAPAPGCYRVFARSDGIPFPAASFDLVICHHGLEHIPSPEITLGEIKRVLKPDGRMIVSVPNGHGLCDGLYRFVFEGGGHVNRFGWKEAVTLIERCADVRLVRWQKLYSSFAYLRRLRMALEERPSSMPRRARLLPGFAITGLQRFLYVGTRLADWAFRTNLSVYGWAFYFDHSGEAAAEARGYLNVCLLCGAGHPAGQLERRRYRRWHCNICDTMSPFIPPFRGNQ